MYDTDRGIEELATRRGDDDVSLTWLTDRMRRVRRPAPGVRDPVDRLATWLARLDDPDD